MIVRTVAIGSTNAAKGRAVRRALGRVWPEAEYREVEVDSGVGAMPLSDGEGARGARTRAERAREALDADLGVGLEGSVADTPEGMFLTGWAAVVDREGRVGLASGARLPLPPAIAAEVRAGAELGPIIDRYAGEADTRHRQGAAGYLTRGLLPRDEQFGIAVLCALAPFLHPALYDR
jgi:inosine/xanthosine triphosphatase